GAEAVVEHGAGEVAPRRGEEVVDARRADPRVRRGDGGARALRQAVGGRVGPAVGTIRLRPPPLVLLLALLLLLLSLPLSEGLSGGAPAATPAPAPDGPEPRPDGRPLGGARAQALADRAPLLAPRPGRLAAAAVAAVLHDRGASGAAVCRRRAAGRPQPRAPARPSTKNG
ncbi:hypothetical protein EG878_17525, partial [Enterococcus faecalis]